MTAIQESSSLEEATSKFVVSTDVADLMIADKPVILCAGSRLRTSDTSRHEVDGSAKTADPYDGCDEILCLSMCAGEPPALPTLLDGNVILVSVVGYISCGAIWYDYVNIDESFLVMAKSQEQKVCPESCPSTSEAHWLDARDFLRRRDGGCFLCACGPSWTKLILPSHRCGLKQAFLCGLFHEANPNVRYQGRACLMHATGSLIINK
jgi:hypothetical protein